MGLAAQIAADASAVFLRTADFAQTITRYPLGVAADAASLSAIVELDEEDAGQGPSIEDERGVQVRRSGKLEIASSAAVNVAQRGNRRDTFVIGGQLWHAERIVGRDAISGLQTVLISRSEGVSTQRTRA